MARSLCRKISFSAPLADSSNHRGMVFRIRQNEAIRQQPANRTKRRPSSRHIARSEDEGGPLAMQIRELRFEGDDGMAIAGDVAGPAGAGAHSHRRLDHRIDDGRMASHSEIIV